LFGSGLGFSFIFSQVFVMAKVGVGLGFDVGSGVCFGHGFIFFALAVDSLSFHRWAKERRELCESLGDIEFKQLKLKPHNCHATPE
jgi:hypothetical protein